MFFWYGTPRDRDIFIPDAHLVVEISSDLSTLCHADGIVVDADYSIEHERNGLRWLQRFWRATRSRLPVLVFAFETQESLATDFSLLSEGLTNIAFLRSPFSYAQFQKTINQLFPLTPEQSQNILRWHAGLQELWRKRAHDFGNALAEWPRTTLYLEQSASHWGETIGEFAPDQIVAWQRLQIAVHSGTLPEIRRALQTLDVGLCLEPISRIADIPPAPYPYPPLGFDSIAIADDHGYEEATIQSLQQMGYHVFQPALNQAQAVTLLQNGRPRVVLSDLNFPLPKYGLDFMRHAAAASCVRLVIAISHATVEANLLPPNVEDCCGAQNYLDAERIHRLIWKRALATGVKKHA